MRSPKTPEPSSHACSKAAGAGQPSGGGWSVALDGGRLQTVGSQDWTPRGSACLENRGDHGQRTVSSAQPGGRVSPTHNHPASSPWETQGPTLFAKRR